MPLCATHKVPGKEEFYETLRYFASEITDKGVDIQLNTHVSADDLVASGADAVVLATGVTPRKLKIEGEDHPSVLSYIDVLTRAKPVGQSVAVIGAGGIGFDVAEFLAHGADTIPPRAPPSPRDASLEPYDALLGGAEEATPRTEPRKDEFLLEWGIDGTNEHRGGLAAGASAGAHGAGSSARKIYLCQRKRGKHGAGLGKTTGWIHRTSLKHREVEMLGGLKYVRVDDEGLHVTSGKEGKPSVIPCDTVVVCAGQVSDASLEKPLKAKGMPTFLIGGAHVAAELDAKRAIDQASRLAADIESAQPEKVGEYVAPLGLNGWLFQKMTSRSKSA